ncbi:MAG TPA: hypothetical protein PK747_03665 [Acidobacteriota bacterium]|nr:hypothetical protein [Acidobacteriota bacterium]HNT16785.1 hypothetical protein [Acidobacteriota bacterium]HPA26422.1 hypothetical protein [Acidobacteriota bacterium]HQO19328.1 hypothetical protein [Acidobacteriota bacterium]HQQ46491.1 hypothetical protein [Acidobacteriota bacterium]
MAQGRKQPVDWVTFRYRDIYMIIAIVVGLIALAIGGIYFWRHSGSPRYKAEIKIKSAEKKFAEVEPNAAPAARTNIDRVRQNIADAKDAFAKEHYKEAIQQASQALEVLKDIGMNTGQKFAIIIETDGTVEVKKASQHIFSPAKDNQLLGEGDMVKTAAKSSARIKYFTGEYHIVAPDTYAVIQNLGTKPGGGNIVKTKIEQGTVEKQTPADMNPQDESILETANAKFRSGPASRIAVQKTESGGTQAQAMSGVTQVQTGSETKELNAQSRAIALSIDEQGGVQMTDLVSPPVPLQPRNEQILQLEDAMSTAISFEWDNPGNKSVQIQIATKPLFQKNIILDKPAITQNKFQIKGFAPSTYYWRVRVEGDESKCYWSSAQRFRIIQKLKAPKLERNLKLDVTATPLGDGAIIRGTTNPGVHVSVNDIEISPNADGSFSKIVLFSDIGSQIIIVRAFDDQGNEKLWQREFKSSTM